MRKITLVTPVYNDWESFRRLLADLASALRDLDCSVEIIAVDDCSSESAPVDIPVNPLISQVRILALASNMGHQRAIAIGLSSIISRSDIDLVAVMDSDGEDSPSELARLIRLATAHPGFIVVGRRAERSEGLSFKTSYYAYKAIFRLLTGRTIDFGNFCVLPFTYVAILLSRPEIWNHFAATIVRARLPLKKLPIPRGKRYFGQSKLNFVELIVHGLGAMSVFSEAVFVRVLLASSVMLITSALGILLVVGIRLFTDLAIPGWTTNVFGFLVLIGIEAAMLPIMMAFMLLNGRATLQPLPKDFASGFVRESRLLATKRPAPEIVHEARR